MRQTKEYKVLRMRTRSIMKVIGPSATAESALAGVKKLQALARSGYTTALLEQGLDDSLEKIRWSAFDEDFAVQSALIGLCEARGDSIASLTTLVYLIEHWDERIAQSAKEAVHRFVESFLERKSQAEASKFLPVLREFYEYYQPPDRDEVEKLIARIE